jgi:hypothetical protein
MINELQQAYLDGASMAYKDIADKMRQMIKNCPPEIKNMMEGWLPFADSVALKAQEVYREAERIDGARQ